MAILDRLAVRPSYIALIIPQSELFTVVLVVQAGTEIKLVALVVGGEVLDH